VNLSHPAMPLVRDMADNMMRFLLAGCLAAAAAWAAADPPIEWVDPDTGHLIRRLTDEPGSASLYFNQNGYLPDGRRLVYTTPSGIYVVDWETRQARRVVEGRVRLIEAGRKQPRVYYIRDGALYWTHADSGETRRVGTLPPRASIATINADESLAAGTFIEGDAQVPMAQPPPAAQGHTLEMPRNRGQWIEQRWAARLPMAIFIMRIDSGQVRVIHRGNDWFNHLLFSPSDPSLLMFCHEGPWHKVDRIWLIRTDGSGLRRVHTRTMEMEIFGHEFWSADGRTVWYDLQTPRGEVFWLAGFEPATGVRTWYHLERNHWSIHFNVSRDGTLFCGDGGDPGQVAHAPDGRWIYLFRPERIPNRGIEDPSFIRPGVLRAEKLVNMAKHDYRLEPNVSFTPDAKWIVFRSNMLGPAYVFAVRVTPARAASVSPHPAEQVP